MDILLNELSLSGQYASREEFVEKILLSLIRVLEEIREQDYPTLVYKNEKFYLSKVTSTDTIHDILVGDLSRQYPSIKKYKRILLSNLFGEPYWEKTRRHKSDDVYKYKEENICNHSVAEACERDRIIISFQGNRLFSEQQLTILKNETELVTLDNLFDAGHYTAVLEKRNIIRPFSLEDKTRFEKQSRVVQGKSVYKEIATGYYWYLDNLHKDHYEVYDGNGGHIGTANMDGDIDRTKKVKGRTLK